jgi:TPR repeat protein
MASAGYVYVLVNPSLPDCVKIGKTTRDTATRAAELSAATGVPTPFMVAYEAYFQDCDSAEMFIHAHLESRGVRLASNREFFSITPSDAINAVIYAQSHLRQGSPDSSNIETIKYSDDLLNELGESLPEQRGIPSPPWQSVLYEADEYRYGLGETLEDEKKAVELYKRAATLGSALAYIRLGEMCALTERYSDGLDWIKRGDLPPACRTT